MGATAAGATAAAVPAAAASHLMALVAMAEPNGQTVYKQGSNTIEKFWLEFQSKVRSHTPIEFIKRSQRGHTTLQI